MTTSRWPVTASLSAVVRGSSPPAGVAVRELRGALAREFPGGSQHWSVQVDGRLNAVKVANLLAAWNDATARKSVVSVTRVVVRVSALGSGVRVPRMLLDWAATHAAKVEIDLVVAPGAEFAEFMLVVASPTRPAIVVTGRSLAVVGAGLSRFRTEGMRSWWLTLCLPRNISGQTGVTLDGSELSWLLRSAGAHVWFAAGGPVS